MLRNLSKKTLTRLLLLGAGLFFFWSCEEESSGSKVAGENALKIEYLLNDAATAYTFYIDSFMRESKVVFDEGNMNDVDDDVMIQQVWDGVSVRWGFRLKPAYEGDEPKVYWWQRASTDVDTQNAYQTIIAELEKARFTPEDLPEPLLGKDSIEIYVLAVVDQYNISASIDLPTDFKKVVLGASVIEGIVTNQTALAEGRSGSKHVEGAAVFLVHKKSGGIFHGFSDDTGRYRVTVLRKDDFYMVVLRDGFQPYRTSLTVAGNLSNKNVSLKELATGRSIDPNQLYKITGDESFISTTGTGYPVSGSALDVGPDNVGAGIGGAFLLFYNRQKPDDELFFLQSGKTGSFDFNIPLPTNVGENDATTLSVGGAAYGYIPRSSSETIGSRGVSGDALTASDILNPLTFTPDPSVNTKTVLTWGSTTTGGPSGFAYQNAAGGEKNIPVFFDSSAVTVHMELKAAGGFVPEPIAVVWTVDGVVDSGQTGLSADFTLDTAGQHTVSASITDRKQRSVTLARVFDLGVGLGPDDPIVTFGDDVVTGGTVTDEGNDGDGNHAKEIEPDQTDGDITVALELDVVDPDTGSDDGLSYEWSVNGEPRGDLGPNPSLLLPPGVHKVKVVVTSKDGDHSTTITRVYTVVGDAGNNNGGSGNQGGNNFSVRFGAGSSGGAIPSTLGIPSSPLRYPVTGAENFSITLKALISNPPVGALAYAWTITDPTSTPARVVLSPSAGTNTEKETFSLGKGTYTVTVSVSAGAVSAKASRTYQIVDQASLNLPTGTTARWRAESSGGAGDLPDSSPLTTFRDDGTESSVKIRAAADFLDAQGNALTPVEWYIDGVLQSGATVADVTLNLPSGGGSAVFTRKVIGFARTANNEPVRIRRVFTLDPNSNNNSRGPRLTWGTSSFPPGVIQSFDGITAKTLTLDVVPTSAGPQTYTYIWSLNGNVVPSQTGASATFSLSRPGRNTVSVTVDNGEGTATVEREYILNTPPTVSISRPTNGSTVVLGNAVPVSASVLDVDTPTVNYTYTWEIQRPGSSTWEDIPGMNPQPTSAIFNLPTTGLSAGPYRLRIRVADGYGGNGEAEVTVIFSAQTQGNIPTLTWNSGSTAAGLLNFDGTTPVSVTLQVDADPSDTATTYAWAINGSVVSGQVASSATLSLSNVGTNTVSVTVSNGANASATLNRVYTLNTQPTVSIALPAAGASVIAGRDLQVRAIANDAETAALSYAWSSRRAGTTAWLPLTNMAQPTTPSFAMRTNGLPEAEYELRVVVGDDNGGSAEATRTFNVVKNSVPVVSPIVLPSSMANGATLQLNSVNRYDKFETFNVSASDVDGDALSYTWSINGVEQSPSTSSSASLNVGNAVGGPNIHTVVITVKVQDPNGAQATQAALVKVNYQPVVTTTAVGTTVTASVSDLDGDTAFTYSWTFAGPYDAVSDSYSDFALPSGTNTTSASFTFPTDGLNAGFRYRARVIVNDGWGGETTANHNFDVN